MTEDFRPRARRPRGFDDKRAAALRAERAIVERVLKVYERWGFERLETSAFEFADALGKFLPDADRPNDGVFALQDDDGQWLALRYDLTAPLARFAAEHWDSLPKPFRRCAAGPVWRNEKPGPGRFREFWQCDADTVGAASPAADAEIIAMACEALEAAGVPRGRYVVKASSRKLLNGLLAAVGVAEGDGKTRLAVLRAVDKLDRLGADGVRALLGAGRLDDSGDFTPGAGLPPAAADRVLAFLSAPAGGRSAALAALDGLIGATAAGAEGLAELSAIDGALAALGVGDDRARFDASIVRGLEYYTGAVFEAELLAEASDEAGRPVRFGSIGGGGRYDDLVTRFRGERVAATGFSVGVSRLAAALEAAGAAQAARADGPVVVLAMDQAAMGEYLALAARLRAAGIAAEVYLGAAGMKAQLKYADRRGAPVAVILGGDERARGEVTVKNLVLGARLAATAGEDREKYAALREEAQRAVPLSALEAEVRKMLA